MKRRRRKSQYRRRRQLLMIKGGAVAVAVLLLTLVIVKVRSSHETVDVSSLVTIHYSGYNTKGGAEIAFDRSALKQVLDKSFAEYEASLFPLNKKYTKSDYDQLAQSFSSSLDHSSELSNGDEIQISVAYNKELAKDLKVDVIYDEISLKVDGLEDATVLSKEDVFKDISVSTNGISPGITAEIVNQTTDPFFKTLTYTISNPKDFYENGDVITVTASYDQDTATKCHYAFANDALSKDFEVSGYDTYVVSANQIPKEVFDQAVALGKTYFTDANAYGLRIFSEANLMPIWIDKKTTFKWSNPYLISAYLQVVKDEYKGAIGKPYNYLELVYEVTITQADGVGCQAEAVVCFSDLTIDNNGNCLLNEESGQLFSASHNDKSIKDSLKGWFEREYDLEKIVISE